MPTVNKNPNDLIQSLSDISRAWSQPTPQNVMNAVNSLPPDVITTGGEAFNKGRKWLGDVMQGYWSNVAEAPARAVYDRLTDIEAGVKGRGLSAGSDYLINTKSGRQLANARPVDPFLNPLAPHPGEESLETTIREIPGSGRDPKYAARVSKGTSTPYTSEPGRGSLGYDPVAPAGMEWAQMLYDNPENTARAVGTTIGIGTPLAAGAFLHSFAQGGKPRSVYAAPVTPVRGGYDDNYNPSVESARVAAQYRHELEEQKFRHKMALQDARQEARTPGVQGTWGGAYDVNSMVDKLYNNRPQYF